LRVVVERRRAVDHAERERALDRRTRTAHADDLARPPGARSRSAGQRSADQADAENDQFVECKA
jgi:hypothetical protein